MGFFQIGLEKILKYTHLIFVTRTFSSAMRKKYFLKKTVKIIANFVQCAPKQTGGDSDQLPLYRHVRITSEDNRKPSKHEKWTILFTGTTNVSAVGGVACVATPFSKFWNAGHKISASRQIQDKFCQYMNLNDNSWNR